MKQMVLTGLFLLVSLSTFGQTGIQILGNPVLNVQSASDYQNGVSVTNQTLQISALLGITITLQVRASGNLINGTNNIPLTLLYMQVTSTTPAGTEVLVTTANKTLYTGGLGSLIINRPITIKYRVASGAGLLKPAGAYTTTLTFTYSGL